MHRAKDRATGGGLVYFHGGGAMVMSAASYARVGARYAVECDLVVFNVDYRPLAREAQT